MTPIQSLQSCLIDKFATTRGRASRSEYWWFHAGLLALSLAWPTSFGSSTTVADGLIELPSLTSVIALLCILLVLLIPSSAVTVRRLHDLNKSGLWLLLGLVPLIGTALLLLFSCCSGTPGPNRYGPEPLESASDSARPSPPSAGLPEPGRTARPDPASGDGVR